MRAGARVLVIGGASLVGSHLCDRLIGDGHEVIAVDDLSSGTYANVAHLRREPRFVFVEHDVARGFRADVDAVYHLAVPSSARRCEADPVKAAMTCVAGTKCALDVARERGARAVIMTSAERWGEGVRCAEALVREYVQARGVDARIVRGLEAYGPRLAPDGDHVVGVLALRALLGGAAEVPRGTTEASPWAAQTEPALEQGVLRLTWVDDAVETLVRAMQREGHTPPVVAPYARTSLDRVAALVARAAGGDAAPSPDEGPQSVGRSTPPATVPDALPASFVLGVAPALDLGEGIRRTIAWLRARLALGGDDRPSGIYTRDAGPVAPRAAS